jgi:hypothetical protein
MTIDNRAEQLHFDFRTRIVKQPSPEDLKPPEDLSAYLRHVAAQEQMPIPLHQDTFVLAQKYHRNWQPRYEQPQHKPRPV